jgi:hypothetical protein
MYMEFAFKVNQNKNFRLILFNYKEWPGVIQDKV